jgi:CRP-like cAMP-binding protein
MIDIDTLICYGATYKKVAKGEIIFLEGSQGRYYHQLVEGRVKWMNVDDSGKEFVQKIIGPGESFGDMPMLDDGPYVATAIADMDSILIRLPKEIFLQLLRENPAIHFHFTKLMAERLREKFILLKEVASQDPERKVSTIIDMYKSVHETEHECCPECHKTKIGLTRQEIADMTGLRVETVIRTIRNLQEKGKLKIQRGKVYC